MYIIDTNVISALSPANKLSDGKIGGWLKANSESLFLSVVTIAEIESGIAKLMRDGARKKAGLLSDWLESLLHLYGDRILPITSEVARLAGRIDDAARGSGISPGFADILIAATARHHGFAILTRNTRHFAPLDCVVIDPWAGSPE